VPADKENKMPKNDGDVSAIANPELDTLIRSLYLYPPKYKHDCRVCVFLGRYKEFDLYYCTQGGKADTILARYSDEGPDYLSGMPNREFTYNSPFHPRTEGYFRAKKLGLIKES